MSRMPGARAHPSALTRLAAAAFATMSLVHRESLGADAISDVIRLCSEAMTVMASKRRGSRLPEGHSPHRSTNAYAVKKPFTSGDDSATDHGHFLQTLAFRTPPMSIVVIFSGRFSPGRPQASSVRVRSLQLPHSYFLHLLCRPSLTASLSFPPFLLATTRGRGVQGRSPSALASGSNGYAVGSEH